MIAGNFEDKYNSKNPISKIFVNNFISVFLDLIKSLDAPQKILEVGVGEGHLIKIVIKNLPEASIWASDLSKDIIKVARKNLKKEKVYLALENAEDLSYDNNTFDLGICCEVLEHVNDPHKALREIRRVIKGQAIISVPQEPLWRVLNMARFKYISSLGNTPGHINHWDPDKFIDLVKHSGFKILSKKYPLPWQMLLIEKV